MTTVLTELLHDERGQDLVEYALLTTVISLAAVVCFDVLSQALGNSYNSWGTEVNNLWESPPPTGGGS
jgi:Flp pilus assembly pilin Flp